MAVTATQIDGNNVALVYAGGSASANVFSLNVVTGAVTSNYLPAEWLGILRDNAQKLFAVTSTAQRQTVQFLDRLISLGSLDGATITSTASVASGIATLVVSVSTNTTVLVQLPHSIFGAASLGQSVPATGGGGGGSVVPADLGLVLWTGLTQPGVAAGDVVGIHALTGRLAESDAAATNTVPAVGVYELDSSANPCIRTSGEVAATGGPFTPGATVYVGTAGAATETPTTTPGTYRQVIGHGTSSGLLFVAPGFVEVV
jgi:hypothetical protein